MPGDPVYSRFNVPLDPGFVCEDDGLTHQEFREECDINRIMARATKTGLIRGVAEVGQYGDFSQDIDFMSAQMMILRGQSEFASLPAVVREKFKNDPARFLSFVHDKNTTIGQLNELGLLSDEAVARLKAQKNDVVEAKPPA